MARRCGERWGRQRRQTEQQRGGSAALHIHASSTVARLAQRHLDSHQVDPQQPQVSPNEAAALSVAAGMRDLGRASTGCLGRRCRPHQDRVGASQSQARAQQAHGGSAGRAGERDGQG